MTYQPKKVTEKQKRFCREWLIDHNGEKAAIRAGFSARTAKVQASTMLSWPLIQVYIRKITAVKNMDLTITAERVLNELARIAFQDPAAYFTINQEGKRILKEIDQLTPDQRAAVSEFDLITKRMKLYDKLSALDKLGKHLKLFTELHEQQHTFTIMPEVKLGGTTLIFNVGAPKPQK